MENILKIIKNILKIIGNIKNDGKYFKN